jgi:D-alanyl-D-alanine carboxypeptidase
MNAQKFNWPQQDNMVPFFGKAGTQACTAGSVKLPFAFPIAWDTSQKITRFSCHKLVAAPLTSIFAEAVKHYGEEDFRFLRLDRFGGCYNYRVMRGSKRLSMHAWGIAVDLDPERNGLRVGKPFAAFSADVYVPFWNIVESYGAVSLGRSRNYDWMHFQFARL